MGDSNQDDRSIQDERIRIATSSPSLKNKISTDIRGNAEAIYWYIRFNIPLDTSTVSHKTMGVTDTGGYIMRTDINYDENKNRIVISPLDTYEQNRYYLLRINRKVRSKRGQRLKSQINILFKLLNNQISEYKILRQEVKLPPVKQRPPNYDITHTRSKVYSNDGTEIASVKQDMLPPADIAINVWLGVIGLLMLGIFMALGVTYFESLPIALIAVGVVVCAIGLGHMFRQLITPENKSLRLYNRGVKKFNRGNYADAKYLFQRSIMLDEHNDYAEYALYKVEFYL